MRLDRIAVIGAGAWGVALANAVVRAGRMVTLVARDAGAADALAETRQSPRLPGIAIDARVSMASLQGRFASDALLLAIPAQSVRAVASALASAVAHGMPVIACAKGIERGTHKFMTDVIAEAMPHALPAILSGPSFAADVARGRPAAVTLACDDEAIAAALAAALGSATFRPYHTTDRRGVEIGGAAKNVLAIAAGIVTGRGLGDSAAAALVTRGFAELFRFGSALGARPETLTGLSGLGDLILTTSSPQSRNHAFGIKLGQTARSVAEGSEPASPLVEGALTASVLAAMAAANGVDMPIATAVADILDGKVSIDDAIESLMTRPFRAEA